MPHGIHLTLFGGRQLPCAASGYYALWGRQLPCAVRLCTLGLFSPSWPLYSAGKQGVMHRWLRDSRFTSAAATTNMTVKRPNGMNGML